MMNALSSEGPTPVKRWPITINLNHVLHTLVWLCACGVLASACSSPSNTAGGERQVCYGNATCNPGLVCASGLCVSLNDAAPTGDGAVAVGDAGVADAGSDAYQAELPDSGVLPDAMTLAADAGAPGTDAATLQDTGADAAHCITDGQCNDHITCTLDTCGATGTCVHSALDSMCSTPLHCDVEVGCIQDSRFCHHDTDCSDGNPCNGVETCVSLQCRPGTPVSCAAWTMDSCNIGQCSPTTGACSTAHVCDAGPNWCDSGTGANCVDSGAGA